MCFQVLKFEIISDIDTIKKTRHCIFLVKKVHLITVEGTT